MDGQIPTESNEVETLKKKIEEYERALTAICLAMKRSLLLGDDLRTKIANYTVAVLAEEKTPEEKEIVKNYFDLYG